MLVVFSAIFVVDTEIIFRYDFTAPLKGFSEKTFLFNGNFKFISVSLKFFIKVRTKTKMFTRYFTKIRYLKPISKAFQIGTLIQLQNQGLREHLDMALGHLESTWALVHLDIRRALRY